MNTDHSTTGAGRLAAWLALDARRAAGNALRITELFEADAQRVKKYSVEAAGLFLDYSKNRLDDATRDDLFALAEACGVAQRRDAMFAGEGTAMSKLVGTM